MHRDDELAMLRTLLSAMAKRAGGVVAFTQEELEEADGSQVFYDWTVDKAGFSYLHLLPDYVHIDDGFDAGEATEEMLDRLQPAVSLGTWTIDNTYYYPSGTTTSSNWGTGTFEMKLSDQGQRFLNQWKAVPPKMASIGWDPAGKIKEISLMADTPKMPEQPAPPAGGGLPTTDPTFTEQGGQAPKENKPAKKTDVRKQR